MKKSLVALAALAVVGAASAQSSVTLYGRIDTGYSANTTTTTDAGGLTSTETKNDGINDQGLVSNKWGMKGSEDLGGGLKANFVLEQGFNSDTGIAGAGFNRNMVLGLSGGFGEFHFGRDYTPMFAMAGAHDVFGTTGAGTVNLYPDGVRASNGFWYTTPAMSGFKATVMLGRNDTGDTSENKGLSASYANGPLMAGLAWGQFDTSVGGSDSKADGMTFSVTYDLGMAKLFGGYTRGKVQPVTSVDASVEQSETNIGVSVPMGAATLMAAYGRNTLDATAGGATAGQTGDDFVVGVSYALSKRTGVYLKIGKYNVLDNTSILDGYKTETTALGVYHNF